MTSLRILEIDHGSAEYHATVELRRKWLREPLGLCFTDREMAADRQSRHLAAYLADQLVGCIVLTPVDATTMRLRQLVVRPDHQRQGVGTTLIEHAEATARRSGALRMVMNARATAIDLYERLGYHAVGEPFVEVTIQHRAMEKSLERPQT